MLARVITAAAAGGHTHSKVRWGFVSNGYVCRCFDGANLCSISVRKSKFFRRTCNFPSTKEILYTSFLPNDRLDLVSPTLVQLENVRTLPSHPFA